MNSPAFNADKMGVCARARVEMGKGPHQHAAQSNSQAMSATSRGQYGCLILRDTHNPATTARTMEVSAARSVSRDLFKTWEARSVNGLHAGPSKGCICAKAIKCSDDFAATQRIARASMETARDCAISRWESVTVRGRDLSFRAAILIYVRKSLRTARKS